MQKSADGEALLHFLSTLEGGRRGPCKSTPGGHRPDCDFGRDEQNIVVFEFVDKESLHQAKVLRP